MWTASAIFCENEFSNSLTLSCTENIECCHQNRLERKSDFILLSTDTYYDYDYAKTNCNADVPVFGQKVFQNVQTFARQEKFLEVTEWAFRIDLEYSN